MNIMNKDNTTIHKNFEKDDCCIIIDNTTTTVSSNNDRYAKLENTQNTDWNITWNNWTQEKLIIFKELIHDQINKGTWTYFGGKPERGKKQNRPHIQGFLQTEMQNKKNLVHLFDTVATGIGVGSIFYGNTDHCRNYAINDKNKTADGECFEMGNYVYRKKGKDINNNSVDLIDGIKQNKRQKIS